MHDDYDRDWAHVDIDAIPSIKVKPPGPKSKEIEQRAASAIKTLVEGLLRPLRSKHGKSQIPPKAGIKPAQGTLTSYA